MLNYLPKRLKAMSLLELLVTLVITSMIMIVMVNIMAVILRISAQTHNRTLLREDLKDFALQFEKDLRNARRVGACEGENGTFNCDFFTDGYYRWTSCTVAKPDLCTENGAANCNDKAPYAGGNRLSMCKYALRPDGSLDPAAEPLITFNYNYNLNVFRIDTVSDEPIVPGQEESGQAQAQESFRRVVTFTAVASHPNKRLGINNVVRQSVVSTKNFEVLIQN